MREGGRRERGREGGREKEKENEPGKGWRGKGREGEVGGERIAL